MTEFNLDLGKRVLEQITLEPDTHHQAHPESCVLGWTVELSDDRKSRHWYDSTKKDGTRLLGVSPRMGGFIWHTTNWMARMTLAHLVAKEERRRYRVAKADAKRAVRIEEETQRALDLQARAQVRAHVKVRPTEEKVSVADKS